METIIFTKMSDSSIDDQEIIDLLDSDISNPRLIYLSAINFKRWIVVENILERVEQIDLDMIRILDKYNRDLGSKIIDKIPSRYEKLCLLAERPGLIQIDHEDLKQILIRKNYALFVNLITRIPCGQWPGILEQIKLSVKEKQNLWRNLEKHQHPYILNWSHRPYFISMDNLEIHLILDLIQNDDTRPEKINLTEPKSKKCVVS